MINYLLSPWVSVIGCSAVDHCMSLHLQVNVKAANDYALFVELNLKAKKTNERNGSASVTCWN
jgi:hypothetical protein